MARRYINFRQPWAQYPRILGDSAGLGLLVDKVGVLRQNCTLYRVIHGYDRSLGHATKRLQIIAMWLIEFTPE